MEDNKEFAIVKVAGKQFRVTPGATVEVPQLKGEAGDEIVLDQVLLLSKEGTDPVIGTPTVEGAKVTAKLVSTARGPKVVVFKKKRRKGYTKKQGHRQTHSTLLIESIAA